MCYSALSSGPFYHGSSAAGSAPASIVSTAACRVFAVPARPLAMLLFAQFGHILSFRRKLQAAALSDRAGEYLKSAALLFGCGGRALPVALQA